MHKSIGLFFSLIVITLLSFHPSSAQSPNNLEIGVDEKLGEFIPLDLTFYDENGNLVTLDELIDRPTIIALVYYTCPGICGPLLNGTAEVLEKMDLKPNEDYRVLAISFDPKDTPVLAAKKKNNYIKSFQEPFPPKAWRFLTADSASIQKITSAIGFRYKKQGKDFVHPGLLTVVSDKGKITRYLYGISFLPFDMKMAIIEAAKGKPGPTISKVLLYCFSYDPEGRAYTFNFLKVTGTIILFLVLVFVIYLIFAGRARKKLVEQN